MSFGGSEKSEGFIRGGRLSNRPSTVADFLETTTILDVNQYQKNRDKRRFAEALHVVFHFICTPIDRSGVILFLPVQVAHVLHVFSSVMMSAVPYCCNLQEMFICFQALLIAFKFILRIRLQAQQGRG